MLAAALLTLGSGCSLLLDFDDPLPDARAIDAAPSDAGPVDAAPSPDAPPDAILMDTGVGGDATPAEDA